MARKIRSYQNQRASRPDSASYGKRQRARSGNGSVMDIPPEQRTWGYYPVPDGAGVRRLIPPTVKEVALRNSSLVRFYDERFKTAMIVHPTKTTYASAANAGAIILYLPGASCVHSQGTAMIGQLTFFAKKGYPGVAVDHAFHGNGPKDPTFNNLNAYMAWVHSIVQYSKRMYADVPIGLFGRSAGANIALEYAARYPGDAAFVVAMSGYDPAWSSFSLYNIGQLVTSGQYELNKPGLEWIETLDDQWMWTDPRAFARVGSNNVLILVGDRDTEYPWYEHQIAEDHARDYGVPPRAHAPYYIDWWKQYASQVDADLAIISEGSHNLFGGFDQRVISDAQQTTMEFLDRTVPKAGNEFFVGRPFHYGSTILELSSDARTLVAEARSIRKTVETHDENVKSKLHLAILYGALSRYGASDDVQAGEYRSMSKELLSKAMEQMTERASYVLLGRPVNDTLIQVGVRHAISQHDPLGLLPKPSSVNDFIGSIYTSRHESTGRSIFVQADIYDFSGRRLNASALCRDGSVVWISLGGDGEALEAARDFWKRNAGVLQGGNGRQVRNRLELQDIYPPAGRSLVIARSEGKEASDELLIARFIELFFEYWPHPTVRRFVERLDDDAGWAKMSPANAGGEQPDLPEFEFSNGGEYIRVQLPHSDQTDGTTLDLVDLSRLRDVQERDPNAGALNKKTRLNQPSLENVWAMPLTTPLVEPTAVLGASFVHMASATTPAKLL